MTFFFTADLEDEDDGALEHPLHHSEGPLRGHEGAAEGVSIRLHGPGERESVHAIAASGHGRVQPTAGGQDDKLPVSQFRSFFDTCQRNLLCFFLFKFDHVSGVEVSA